MVTLELMIGLIIARYPPSSSWGGPIWMPVQALDQMPETPAWSRLSADAGRETFYAGAFPVMLYASETEFYRDNLATGTPKLWVVMQPDVGEEDPGQRVEIVQVTADPTEGEGHTQTGTYVVEVVDMPPSTAVAAAEFVEQNHVERVFEKRKRDRKVPLTPGLGAPRDGAKR